MMGIDVLFQSYIEEKRSYCSPDTVYYYELQTGFFINWYRRQEKDFSRELFISYLNHLRSLPVKNVTMCTYYRAAKTFCSWLYENGYVESNYAARVKLPKNDAEIKVPLSSAEVKKIDALLNRSNVYDLRNWCVTHLMLDCGMRLREASMLSVNEISYDNSYFHFMGKGYKRRIVPCPGFLLAEITRYMRLTDVSGGHIFCNKSGGPLTKDAIECYMHRMKRKTGIDRLHSHLLRHTFATSYLCGGGNLEFLRILMGHSSIDITQNYLHVMSVLQMMNYDIYQLDPVFFKFGHLYRK